jgi:hypothetical protein
MGFSTHKLVVLAMLMLSVCGQSFAAKRPESVPATALATRFESVLYAKSDLVFAPGAYVGFSPLESSSLRQPFALLPAAIHSLGEWAAAEIIQGSEAVLVGAKDFRAPAGSEGLGQVRSQFCYIVILKNASGVQVRKYFSADEPPSGLAAGFPVWHWSAKLNEFGRDDPKPSSLYVTEVSSSYLLLSNDLGDLQDLAARLTSSNQESQPSSTLRDWELIGEHKFWGYRRYRHTGVLNPVAAGTSEVTPSAEALTFYLDFDNRVGVLRLLCSVTDEDAVAKMNARAVLPRLTRSAPGVWETRTRLSGNEESAERIFVIMSLFGFGIYL